MSTATSHERTPTIDRVSAVIVHYRTPDLLRNCLASLEPYASRGMEVVVVDNDSGDRFPDFVADEYPDVHLLPMTDNVGYSRGVNAGMDAAGGEFLLILNPDIVLIPGAVEALLTAAAAHPDAGVVAPKLLNPDGTLQYSCRRFYDFETFVYRRTPLGRLRPNAPVLRRHMMLDYDHETPRVVDWVLGGAMLVRRAAVEDVGGMDERFFLYFEDVDWCYRMHRRGWRVLYDPAAAMYHNHRRDSAKKPLGKSFFSHLMSVVRFYEKWSLVLYLFKTQREDIGRLLRLVFDVVAINLAFVCAYAIRKGLGDILEKPVFGVAEYQPFWLFGNLLALVVFYMLGFYRREPRGQDWVDRLFTVGRGAAIVTIIMMATTFLVQARSYSRAMLMVVWPLATTFLVLGRQAVAAFASSMRDQRLDLPRVAIAGRADRVAEVRQEYRRETDLAFEPLYFPDFELGRARDEVPPDDLLDRFIEIVRFERIASVQFVTPGEDAALLTELVPRLARAGVGVRILPEYAAVLNPDARVEDVAGTWTLSLGTRTRWRAASAGKRLVDVAASSVLIAIGAPANAFFVALRWLRGIRPIFSVEERVAAAGQRVTYRMYTPRPRQNILAVVLFDHYPRLFAVWRGTFSLVGVYPFRPEEFRALPPALRSLTLEARPGLTGLWWFHRGSEPGLERLRGLDVEYVQKWSTGFDLKTFLRALTALIRSRGHMPDHDRPAPVGSAPGGLHQAGTRR